MNTINHNEINTTDTTDNDNMNLDGINYYSIEHPDSGNLVLVKFNRQENAFFGILLEYSGYSCIMNYKDALKKKKVYNWSKFITMDKVLVVQVDDVDTVNKIVQVSMAYLADNFKEDLTQTQLQHKLMKPFIENKIFENFIKSVCIIKKLDFKNIWVSLVHHIDKLRRETSDEDSMCSLYDYFAMNIDDIGKWIEYCKLDESIGTAIINLYLKRTKETPRKITSKFGIISLGGVNASKKLISNVLNQLNYTHSLRYDTTPYYIFETSTEDSDVQSHNKFIQAIEMESVKFDPKIFIKTNFIGKLSTN
jgi:translation initiation factor 2 alpha subunit (eIF-2alpha)